jgi:pimeloyl-ACP methyl ester carboxylesterase
MAWFGLNTATGALILAALAHTSAGPWYWIVAGIDIILVLFGFKWLEYFYRYTAAILVVCYIALAVYLFTHFTLHVPRQTGPVQWGVAISTVAGFSLTLIEPGCYQVAADDPVVAAAIRANREGHAGLPADLPPGVYLRAATDSVGWPPLEPTPARLRAAAAALRERPCWEAEMPVAALARARWPKLVIGGTWETAPPLYRQRGGAPLMACARVTAARIGARLLRIPGSSHYPHAEQPGQVSAALDEIFSQAAAPAAAAPAGAGRAVNAVTRCGPAPRAGPR